MEWDDEWLDNEDRDWLNDHEEDPDTVISPTMTCAGKWYDSKSYSNTISNNNFERKRLKTNTKKVYRPHNRISGFGKWRSV